MAIVQRKQCDLCGSEQDVDTMAVVYAYKSNTPWEVDMCAKCYKSRMGDIAELGRRTKLKNLRPQHRMKKTEITEANL